MKHPDHTTPVRLYLAGKITKNGWRNEIVPCLRDAWGAPCLDAADWRDIDPLDFWFGGVRFHYTGPYFVGCDHGCFHGPNSHGILDVDEETAEDNDAARRESVFHLCMRWLAEAQVVFAHIDAPDAQGSLFEIGCAYGRRPVFLNFASEDVASECWFAAKGAERVSVNPDPRRAFFNFIHRMELVAGIGSRFVQPARSNLWT